jgi:2-polyprenyl-3-methyl-5-hydroxy-6-metoxy-1,4-benzoquinol methylase
MDRETVGAYDREPAAFAAEWEDHQPEPADLYALLKPYFRAGATADVGCGSGRDTAWLAANGFSPIGYDASPGLLAEARRRHPGVIFEQATLPALEAVPRATFANVLCETVIMHLPVADIGASVTALAELLAPGGTLYLSWRVTEEGDRRDPRGRLYAAFPSSLVTSALTRTTIVHEEETRSESSGALVLRIVARAPDS